MAKVSSIQKNNKRRHLVEVYKARRQKLNAIVYDKNIKVEERFMASIKLAQLPRNSARIRIRNRCEVSGSPRSTYRKLKMSRIAIRDYASQGWITGMTKSSW